MLLLGIYFYLKSIMYDIAFIYWVPIVAIISFNCMTTISFSNLMIIRCELLPTYVRALGVGILQILFTISSFVAIYMYPIMIETIESYWTFWIFGITNIVMVIIIVAFIPETRGKSLEQIGKFQFK